MAMILSFIIIFALIVLVIIGVLAAFKMMYDVVIKEWL